MMYKNYLKILTAVLCLAVSFTLFTIYYFITSSVVAEISDSIDLQFFPLESNSNSKVVQDRPRFAYSHFSQSQSQPEHKDQTGSRSHQVPARYGAAVRNAEHEDFDHSHTQRQNSNAKVLKQRPRSAFSHSSQSQTGSHQVPARYGAAVGNAEDFDNSHSHTQRQNSNSNAKNFDVIESEINERIQRVEKLCQKYHLGKWNWNNGSNSVGLKEPPTPLYSYFFWNRERHLTWCPVYKAGSTSWLYNMMILAGFSEQELERPTKQFSVLAREAYGDAEPDEETFERTLKLLIVRHPFDRLLSAYKDKLSNSSVGHEHGTHHFYLKYGKKIVKKFRKDSSISQIEPTWEEFVRYLLSTDLIHYSDDHWLPVFYSCTPCLVKYDIIAKMETYSRDQELIIYKAGLEGILKPRWNHQTLFNKDGRKRSEITKKYFSQLKKSQIDQLYQKYWLDFELFGYEYKTYRKYGRN